MEDKMSAILTGLAICLFILGISTAIVVIINAISQDDDICDYDSCSQEIYLWNYTGEMCWDNNNPDCQDFLRLWHVCQSHKERVGSC